MLNPVNTNVVNQETVHALSSSNNSRPHNETQHAPLTVIGSYTSE